MTVVKFNVTGNGREIMLINVGIKYDPPEYLWQIIGPLGVEELVTREEDSQAKKWLMDASARAGAELDIDAIDDMLIELDMFHCGQRPGP